jgi:hypothetical protein
MAITSVWFVSSERGVMRRDATPDGERWWGPVSIGRALPGHAAVGVGPEQTAAGVGDAFAMTATTAGVNGILFDLARGGCPAGRLFLRAANVPFGGRSLTGFGEPGRALMLSQNGREIVDTVRDTSEPAGDRLTFTGQPSGEPIDVEGPAAALEDGTIIQLVAGGVQRFNPATRTADDVGPPIAQMFPPLAAANIENAVMFQTTGDPDDWPAAPATADVPTAVLRAIADAAAAIDDLDPLALAIVCDLESGLRPDAFHPLGRYGLLQLDVSALNLAGWGDGSAALLTAPPAAQAPIIAAHLAGLNVDDAPDPGPLWASMLTMRDPLGSLTPETVVAGRDGPRADLYATHAAVDTTSDGAITVGDLGAFFVARFDDRRMQELERRLRALRR